MDITESARQQEKDIQRRDAGAAGQSERARAWHIVWVIGLLVLISASVIVHFHPGPWPLDLQTMVAVQHFHLWAILGGTLWLASVVNDPIASTVQLVLWLIVLVTIGFIVKSRGRDAARWFLTGIFISFGTAALDGLDGLISLVVGRPRPASPLIHVYISEPFHSFPSGHAEHDTLYYGFLLYLSLSWPVNRWKYRWILIPFQLYMALIIAVIGYSRIFEGSHWITDVLGGYLSGALFLGLLIFLYRRMVDHFENRRAQKLEQRAVSADSH